MMQTRLLIAGGILLLGLFLGYSFEKSRFDSYKKEVEIAGLVAQQLTLEKEKKQQQVSDNITKGYANAVQDLKRHYTSKHNRVLNNTSGSEVSNIPTTSSTTNDNSKSNQPTTNGVEVTEEMCASDVLQLITLQRWVTEQAH